MTVKDKQAKQKFGYGWMLLVFAVLIILSILGSFIGILQASVVGLVIAVSVVIFLRKKVKSKTATKDENIIYGVAVIVSLFLVMDVLTFGFLYSQGGYTPQLLNVSFPTAQQASSIFHTSLITLSGPSSFGNVDTGTNETLADASESYYLTSDASSINITILIWQYNNSTDAEKAYSGWTNIYPNRTYGNYNNLTYTVFNTFAAAYINNYEIDLEASHSINRTSTINFLKKEADIINGNS